MMVPDTGEVLSSSKANFREAFLLGRLPFPFNLAFFGVLPLTFDGEHSMLEGLFNSPPEGYGLYKEKSFRFTPSGFQNIIQKDFSFENYGLDNSFIHKIWTIYQNYHQYNVKFHLHVVTNIIAPSCKKELTS